MNSIPTELSYINEETGHWYKIDLWELGLNEPVVAELSFIFAPGNGTEMFKLIVEQLKQFNSWVRLEIEATTPRSVHLMESLYRNSEYNLEYGQSLVNTQVHVYYLDINKPNYKDSDTNPSTS